MENDSHFWKSNFQSSIHKSFTRVGLQKAAPLNVFTSREFPPCEMISHRDKWSPTWEWFATVGIVSHYGKSFPNVVPIIRSCIHSPIRIIHIQQQNEVLLTRWRPCAIFISIVLHINHLEDFESIKTVVEALCDNATISYAGQWILTRVNEPGVIPTRYFSIFLNCFECLSLASNYFILNWMVMRCFALLCIVMSCFALLCLTLICTDCIDLHCFGLLRVILYCFFLFRIALHCFASLCIVRLALYWFVLRRFALLCIALHWFAWLRFVLLYIVLLCIASRYLASLCIAWFYACIAQLCLVLLCFVLFCITLHRSALHCFPLISDFG